MRNKPLSREQGLRKAKRLKKLLIAAQIPVNALYLYGSVARGTTHEWSDIDVAVICTPFRPTRHDENMEVRRIRRGVDVRIEPVCLHPDDMENRLFGLAQEIRRTGMAV
jgi:predicted nucleotidyltransferase